MGHGIYIKGGANNGDWCVISAITATVLTMTPDCTLVDVTNETGSELHGGETNKVFAALNIKEIGI